MDIRNHSFYYFSVEFFSECLPIKCKFLKTLRALNAVDDRQVALIELEAKPDIFLPKHLLILPRSLQDSIFDDSSEQCIFLYVLNGEGFLEKDEVDLSENQKLHPIDVGGITLSYEKAKEWQVSKDAIESSKEDMKKFLQ